MKKIHRLAVAVLSLSLVFCSCFQTEFSVGSASAEETESSPLTTDNTYDGPYEGNLSGGFSFKIDDATKTLTLMGNGVFPSCKVDENPFPFYFYELKTLVIEDGITGFNSSVGLIEGDPEKVIIGKDCKDLGSKAFATQSYQVDAENPYLTAYDDCLYTKDHKKLIRCPTEKTSIDFHPNLEILGEWSLNGTSIDNSNRIGYSPVLVIPWGVTTMEDSVFGRYDDYAVFLPDTLVNINEHSCNSEYTTMYSSSFLYQILNKKYENIYNYDVVETAPSEREAYRTISIQRLYGQYGIQPNSLKILDGKAYYFDENYNHPVGWKQVNGNWYYFNDYGAGVVKIWLKSGNKWYFMQADGTMAKSRWIKWYNKWYYVDSSGAMYANRWIKSSGKWYYLGSDGAMYTNRYTPDGYWVNANGVWA